MKKILTIACLLLLVAFFAVNLIPADERPTKQFDKPPAIPLGVTFIIKDDPPVFHRHNYDAHVPDYRDRDYICFYNSTNSTVHIVNDSTPVGQIPFSTLELASGDFKCDDSLLCGTHEEGVYTFIIEENLPADACTVDFDCYPFGKVFDRSLR